MTEFESWLTFSFFFLFRLWLGKEEFTNASSITSLRIPCLRGWVPFTVSTFYLYRFFSLYKILKMNLFHLLVRGKSLIVMMVTEQWSVQIVMDTAFLQIKNQTRWAFSCVISVCVCCVSSVPRGADHQTETDCSGLQGQLLAGQSLQVGPEEVPLQRGHQHAPSEGSSPVLPSAVSGVSRPSRWADLYLSLLAPATN